MAILLDYSIWFGALFAIFSAWVTYENLGWAENNGSGGGLVRLFPILYLVWFFAVPIAQAVMLNRSGQTFGKKIMHIRIVDVSTNRNAGFVRTVLVRFFLNGILVFVPFYGIVDSMFIFSDSRRCLHDRLADTKVIKA